MVVSARTAGLSKNRPFSKAAKPKAAVIKYIGKSIGLPEKQIVGEGIEYKVIDGKLEFSGVPSEKKLKEKLNVK